jgi:hypothetical protein
MWMPVMEWRWVVNGTEKDKELRVKTTGQINHIGVEITEWVAGIKETVSQV